MFVFRIESREDNYGIYNRGYRLVNKFYTYDNRIHPRADEDSLFKKEASKRGISGEDFYGSDEYGNYRFGFASIAQLRSWFFKDESLVDFSTDFILSVYNVPDQCVIVGNCQAVFHADFHNQEYLARRYNLKELVESDFAVDLE